MQQLINSKLVDNNLEIRFKEFWFQEDIDKLYQLLQPYLTNFTLVESYLGADRQTYRLTHQQQYLLLNFDYYSQSCWFSVDMPEEQVLLTDLSTQILTNTNIVTNK